jgi:hypothetical protein
MMYGIVRTHIGEERSRQVVKANITIITKLTNCEQSERRSSWNILGVSILTIPKYHEAHDGAITSHETWTNTSTFQIRNFFALVVPALSADRQDSSLLALLPHELP